MLSPRQIFEDNIRPAELMLRVYRLLEHDVPPTDGAMVQALRALVQAEADEGLMLIYNEIFLGLIRERAQIAPMAIRRSALRNDIVHRADREKKTLDGPQQEIGYAWAKQAVDTISHVCLCLDELVAAHMTELREQLQVGQAVEAS